MNKGKILGILLIAGASIFTVGGGAQLNANKVKTNNNVLLVKSNTTNLKKNSNSTLTKEEVNSLKNKTIEVHGMKFSGLKAVKIASDMPTGEFAAIPGFNPDGFASSVNQELYNYELNPANDQAAMNEATQLHGGNPIDTCVYFQSSALRAIGQNVPYYIGYTTHLENWLANNGWTRHTNFQFIQRGDICFAGTYHTFLFMGWEDKAKGIAYVMGNESFTEPYYRNRNLNGQSPVTYGNNSYYQATCYWTYGQGYTGPVIGNNPVHQGGYNAIGTATAISSLNIQAGPNTWSNVIGNVPNDVTVPVISTDGVWYKVYYNGVTGWIDGNYTDGLDESLGKGAAPTNMPQGDNLTVTSPIGLWLTNGPSAESGNIVLLPNGTPVKALAFQNGWYKVNYEGTIGWLDAQYTSANGKDILPNTSIPKQPQSRTFTQHEVNGTVTVDCDGLWINENPFVNDGNIIIVPHGTKLQATAESNNGWYKVTYKGHTGWIGGSPYSSFKPSSERSYTVTKTFTNEDYVTTTTSDLCMNKKPFPNDGVITVLPKGTTVKVIAESNNGWYKVQYKGQTGWIGGPYTNGLKKIYLQPVGDVKSEILGHEVIGQVVVTADGLCLNEHPAPNDGIIKVLHKGTVVDLLGTTSNGWYHVVYSNGNGEYTEGYIGGSPYSKIVSSQPVQQSVPRTQPVNQAQKILGKVEVTAGGLCMNENPAPNDGIITVLKHGTVVPYVAVSSNGWYKVIYNDKEGWIGGSPYSKIVNDNNNNNNSQSSNNVIGTTTITSPIGLWELNSPSMAGGHLQVIPYGAKVNVYGENNGWYEVSYKGQKGWSYSKYTSGLNNANTSSQKATVISPVGLWLNSTPSVGNGIEVMPYRATMTILGQEGNWTKVNYNGTIGWCYTKYITMNN